MAHGRACAGRTVHPRTCGEHVACLAKQSIMHGSSPHLRGTQRRSGRRRDGRRFIPAPAGNTRPRGSPMCRPSVHPRTCGEHYFQRMKFTVQPGSSPHLRGTQAFRHRHIAVFRFIPAPAGNTRCISASFFASSVHPRTCGEHGLF